MNPLSVIEPLASAEDGAALNGEREHRIGRRILKKVARLLVDYGWTPEHYDTLARLADWGWESFQVRTGETSCVGLLRTLTWHAEHAAMQGAPWAELLPWLTVLVGEPDEQRADSLRGSLVAGSWIQFSEVWPGAPGVPPVLASLAWAAGLSRREMRSQNAAGTLTEPELRTLAALRGYRLPPIAAGVA